MSQSTGIRAQTPMTWLFNLPSGSLDSSTSTSGGADRADANEEAELPADLSGKTKTVPGNDDNEPIEQDDDD